MFVSGDFHVAFESMVLDFENYAYLHFTLMLYWCPRPYQTQSNDCHQFNSRSSLGEILYLWLVANTIYQRSEENGQTALNWQGGNHL